MHLLGSRSQSFRDFGYYADGTTSAGTTVATLVLPEMPSRSMLYFVNNSAHAMWLGFGSARATCTISSGQVATVSVTNQGFGFSKPPHVTFYGGGIPPQQGQYAPISNYVGAPGPNFPAPNHPAQAHCVMAGSVPNQTVSSIVIDDPGNGYVSAPMVFLHNDVLDPNGCFDPSITPSGIQLAPFGSFGCSLYFSHTAVPTDQIAVFCATASQTYSCLWQP